MIHAISMKKIVLFSAFVSPYRSGAEACAEEVAARLKDRYDITIIAARMRKDLPIDDVLPTGVKVKRVGFGSSIDKWLYPILAPSAAAALQPDIIHAVLESFAGLALMFSKSVVPHAKRILTCQSTNTSLLVAPMHRAAHRVTAISSVLVARAKHFGVDATLIPNGIRSKELLEASAERVPGRILFVGRLEPMKGVDTLLEAFAVILRRAPAYAPGLRTGTQDDSAGVMVSPTNHDTVHLRIVGAGSERDRLERIATELKIADRITFVGKVAHDRIATEYASAEIFCGLSTSEAFGNVFIEAQAVGCAVVATNVGGIPDIVHNGATGLLVPPKDPAAAADALLRLLDDDDLRRRLGEGGRANAAKYDWEGISERYTTVYEKLTK